MWKYFKITQPEKLLNSGQFRMSISARPTGKADRFWAVCKMTKSTEPARCHAPCGRFVWRRSIRIPSGNLVNLDQSTKNARSRFPQVNSSVPKESTFSSGQYIRVLARTMFSFGQFWFVIFTPCIIGSVTSSPWSAVSAQSLSETRGFRVFEAEIGRFESTPEGSAQQPDNH